MPSDRRCEAKVRLKCRNKEARHLNLLRSYLSRSVEADMKMIAWTARFNLVLCTLLIFPVVTDKELRSLHFASSGKALVSKGISNIDAFYHAFIFRTLQRPRLSL